MSTGKMIGIALLALVGAVVLGWGLQASGIVSMNIQREVVQHSQQYSETKVSLLMKLHGDWLQLEAEIAESTDDVARAKRAQQANIVSKMKVEAARIPDGEVPRDVATFLATH